MSISNDFLDAVDRVEELKSDLADNLGDKVKKGMEDVEQKVGEEIDRNDSVASGNLLSKLTMTRGFRATNLQYKVSVPAQYKYLEYGTGIYSQNGYKAADPKPPLAPILEWIVEKGIQPDNPDDDAVDLAFLIQDVLSKGNIAHPFMRPVWRRYGEQRVILAGKTAIRKSVRHF